MKPAFFSLLVPFAIVFGASIFTSIGAKKAERAEAENSKKENTEDE